MTPRGDRLTQLAPFAFESGGFRAAPLWYTLWIDYTSTQSPGWARVLVMNAPLRNPRVPTVVLLLLCAAPPGAAAEDFVCWPIGRGDTASSLALQLTGDAARAYSDVFQIRDPSRRMFLPKSQYQRLNTDWQACVARGAMKPQLLAPDPPAVKSRLLAPAPAVASAVGSPDDVPFAVEIAVAVGFMLLTYSAVAVLVAARPIPPVMQRAGELFISEFARPLIDPSSNRPPIAVRLRFVRHPQHLEISIAPGDGRRYPNLVDHKRNVEYDVNRVMRLLGSRFVVSDRLRATGKWVTVRIRLADQKQAGVP